MRRLERTVPLDEGPPVSSIWSVPERYRAGGSAVILAHGAGNDMHSPFLATLADGLARHGLLSVRFNFPYKERGGKAPDRAPRLEATWRAVVARVRADVELTPGRLFLAGKSMGGRMASHLAAAGEACDGLVLFGYPLHPARQPERPRVQHLGAIRVPMLFFAGTRDPLCDLDLLRRTLSGLSAAVTLHVVEGGDHSFEVLKRLGRTRQAVLDELIDSTAAWIDRQR